MKIAFVGAFGYGNAGDDTYPEVFRDCLPRHHLIFYNSDLPVSLPRDLDLLVMGGGGILHNTARKDHGDHSLHVKRMSFYMDWAINQDIPWGFLSCGFQFSPNGEAQYKETLRPWIPYLQKADFITLRSPRCAQIAYQLTGRTDIRFVPDVAYLYSPVELPVQNRAKRLTIIPAGAVNPGDKFMQHFIRLFRSMDYEIVWLGMGSPSDDEPHLQDARRFYPQAEIRRAQNPREAFEFLAHSRMVFSGRYHGMVFARRSGVPFFVPEQAPFKLVNENYEAPMETASEHIAVVKSFLPDA
ncbi:MAG: polysaccharide pyruvyl transferase family protein [Chthoniobacter sp.]